MHKLPMIDHVSKVKEKVHLLDVLKEIDVINKYIQIIIDVILLIIIYRNFLIKLSI